ncbi:PASTA domain-containing protein [Streptomyces geranii]|uniref:PASTA domain-containing protein n=1 Tax=Streptomyces geranii TaxID=2058923 RepID=UPI001E5D7EAC|nr:PASTA domain-containing protein [Streptomyces geranii]
MVKAVASGVPSLAPFFDESSGLGQDAQVRSQPAHGSSLQQGSTPGLYGGTRKPTVCDVDKLTQFLTDPKNNRKAQEWARVVDIPQARIPAYLDRLTPVLLRHDTLVKNHDYKKEKAVPYDALLQAGIAVLVDEAGVPAVKCSCGNPLKPFKGDTDRISVEFEGDNKKWSDYDVDEVVLVRPAPGKVDRFALVDVDEPERGIYRQTGTKGEADKVFDTRERHRVPSLAGTTFGNASGQLTDLGLATAYDTDGLPPSNATVTGSNPPPGTSLPFGSYVTLTVHIESGTPDNGTGGSDGNDVTTPPGTTVPGSPGTTSPAPPSTSAPGSPSTSAPGPDTPAPSSSDPPPPSDPPDPSDSPDPSPPSSEPPPPVTDTPNSDPTSDPPSTPPEITSAPPDPPPPEPTPSPTPTPTPPP